MWYNTLCYAMGYLKRYHSLTSVQLYIMIFILSEAFQHEKLYLGLQYGTYKHKQIKRSTIYISNYVDSIEQFHCLVYQLVYIFSVLSTTSRLFVYCSLLSHWYKHKTMSCAQFIIGTQYALRYKFHIQYRSINCNLLLILTHSSQYFEMFLADSK